MIEQWKIYSEHAGNNKRHLIEVSNLGNVRVDGKLYDLSRLKGRYYQVHLLYVHRMVAELFVSNPENKPFVDHIDSNRYNNAASNLRWATYLENNRNPNTIKKMKTGWTEEAKLRLKKSLNRYRKNNPNWKEVQSKSMKQWFTDPNNKQKFLNRMQSIDYSNFNFNIWNKGKKNLTDGTVEVFVEPEYWGEFIDIGFWFKNSIFNKLRKKNIKK